MLLTCILYCGAGPGCLISTICKDSRLLLREGTFLIGGGGGWAGASEGRVITKFFPNCGGSKLFYSRLGEGHSFFGKEKITPCHLVDSHSSTNT